jgi:branched-chain amino acid transport system ATP-binding protein
MEIILQIENVVKRFGGLVAVDRVSLEIKRGEIFGLIGPNGAGKSTLLNVISGIYPPEEGKVIFKGKDIMKLKPYDRCHKGIARTFQIVRSFHKMTVLDNVRVAAVFGCGDKFGSNTILPFPKVDDGLHAPGTALAMQILDFIGFPVAIDTIAENLNTIQLKYLELARALASNGELLLLDELAAGLTPGELPELIKLINRIRDLGVTIIAIEHVMKLIMEICDNIAVLQYGKLIGQGTPDEIINDPIITKAYLGEQYIL